MQIPFLPYVLTIVRGAQRMSQKILTGSLFVPLAFALVFAQDATKVEPRHYRLAFENEKVQVVYIQYGPHEKSREHSHPQGVVVNITDAHLRFTDEDGKVRELYAKAGEARWFPAFRHTVENLGDTVYSGVYIGVKAGESAGGRAKRQPPQMDEQTTEIMAAFLLNSDSGQPSAQVSRH